jgi:hypothetical protein
MEDHEPLWLKYMWIEFGLLLQVVILLCTDKLFRRHLHDCLAKGVNMECRAYGAMAGGLAWLGFGVECSKNPLGGKI